jgi:hypothetical protein
MAACRSPTTATRCITSSATRAPAPLIDRHTADLAAARTQARVRPQRGIRRLRIGCQQCNRARAGTAPRRPFTDPFTRTKQAGPKIIFGPVACDFVAGAGFEPATSGL